MKKSTKLLSIFLAVLMIFSSISVGAFAAKASYQTVANLTSLSAYSPYGTVTRLSTEERMSIIMDSLDLTLAQANINMGTVFNTLGITITLDFRSINAICGSLDTLKTATGKFLFSIAKAILDLGIVEELKMNNWTSGMSREGTTQMTIINTLLNLLAGNTNLVDDIFSSGIQLGMIGKLIRGLDLSSINNLVVDLPKLINGIVLPLFSRQDDNAAQRNTLGNTGSDLMTVAQNFINGIFNKKMGWTSYRVDASGNSIGATDALPMNAAAGTSRYFVAGTNAQGKKTLTQYDYKYASVLGGDPAGYYETVTYTMSDTEEKTGSGVYLYNAPDDYEGDKTLKWYKSETYVDDNGRKQSGYWLKSIAGTVGTQGGISLNINGNDSVAGLLYKWAPVIFAELAPTVANGSLKKLIAGAFDVQFTKIGVKGDDAVAAVAAATGNPDNFFTKEQEYYVWEYSDYKVINGTPYYRFQDEYFVGDVPKNISTFYNMINWDYELPANFMNKYIPASVGATSAAGYTRVLPALNDFVYDLIQLFINESWECKGTTVYRSDVFAWAAGDNSHIVDNVRAVATNVFNLAPEEIVDEYYADAQFYNAMMNGTNAQAVNGLICAAVQLLMPQIKFADNIVDQPMLAIAAAVVRELCSQLMPTYNFDAMIFSDYNNRAMLTGKDSDYWLNTVLYMGVNLGMYYLRNLADLGEDDTTNGYYGAMKTLGALPAPAGSTSAGDGYTFSATAQYVNGTVSNANASWLRMVDWVIDWALSSEVEWAWHFGKLLGEGDNANDVIGTNKVELKSYQNPFIKLDKILLAFLPFDQLLESKDLPTAYGSNTFLEKILYGGLVNSITTLNVPQLVGALAVPTTGCFCKNNIADELVKIIVNLLNKVLYRVAGRTNVVSGITSVSTLLNHNNLKNVVKTLVGKLYAASNTYNVLDPILPLANFFIGWTTDPQKYSEPTLYYTSSSNDTFALNTSTNTINVVNNSSGMLLKHRNSTTTDAAYKIKITGVTATKGVSTTKTIPFEVEPGAIGEIPLTIPNSSDVSKITIKYQFYGKNGAVLANTEFSKVMYLYFTNVDDQENVMTRDSGADDLDYFGQDEFKQYEFTEDLYNSVLNYKGSLYSTTSTVGAVFGGGQKVKYFVSITAPDNNTDMSAKTKTYFGFQTSAPTSSNQTSAGGWPWEIAKDGAAAGNLYVAKSGVTANTFSQANSEANNLYGLYDMGRYAIKYSSTSHTRNGKSATFYPDFYYYNSYGISEIKDKYVAKGLQASDFSAAATSAFNAYETALMNVVKLADHEKRTDYLTVVQANIPAAITALENAYETLMAFGQVDHVGDVSKVETKLDSYEVLKDKNGNQRDINYQDYRLFEYFQYEKQRTSAREMIKATKAPEAPQKYVENSVWGTSVINAIDALYSSTTAVQALYDDADPRKAAITKDYVENVKKGIDAKVITPTAEEEADWQNAVDSFVPAKYSILEVADKESKIGYYYTFMNSNSKTVDKTFLQKEIAYAEAQNYAAKHAANPYSTDSWNRYNEALANAKEVYNTSAMQADIFDAKYELMAAQNALLLASHSMKDCGYLDRELNTVIAQANNILDYYKSNGEGYYKLVDGITEDEALGQLVWALGIYYNVTADGIKQDGYVFDRSAATFAAYDRVNSVKNMRAVDLVADHLREAIANFKIDVKVTATDTTAVQDIDQEVRFIQGIKPGSIDSIDTLLSKVTSTAGTLVGAANVDGHFGTGATVTVKIGDVDVTKYIVVIYGDVNGDGAVDGFDLFDVNKHNNRLMTLLNIYETAGDIDGNGKVDLGDYSAIMTQLSGGTAIDQTHSA